MDTNISPLDQDSFEVTSWEELFKWSIQNDRRNDFIKKLSDFIVASNHLVKIGYDQYFKKRIAEITREGLENCPKRPFKRPTIDYN